MNDHILPTRLKIRDYLIHLDLLLLQCQLQPLILLMRGVVEPMRVSDQQNHQDRYLRYFYEYDNDGGEDDGDVVGEDVGGEGKMIGYCFGVGGQSAD